MSKKATPKKLPRARDVTKAPAPIMPLRGSGSTGSQPRSHERKPSPNDRWLTGAELIRMWEVDTFELSRLILDHGLPAFDSGNGRYINPAWSSDHGLFTYYPEQYVGGLRFAESQIKDWIKKHPEFGVKSTAGKMRKRKPVNQHETEEPSTAKSSQKRARTSTQDKIKCQKIATQLWKEHGNKIASSGKMADRPEIIKCGKEYGHRQRQRWVSKVAPEFARRPGMRPKNP